MAALSQTWRSGIWSQTQVKITIFSMSQSDITLTMDDGQTFLFQDNGSGTADINWIGADPLGGADDSGLLGRDAVLFSAEQVVTCAKGHHTFTVTQDGQTRPGATSTDIGDVDGAICFMTCDNRRGEPQVPPSPTPGVYYNQNKGSYSALRSRIEDKTKPPLFCAVHTDDHGYCDKWIIDDSAHSGLYINDSPYEHGTEFAWALAYAAYLGLIESEYYHHPDNGDRVWCHENLPFLTNIGDHEFVNNTEEDDTWTKSGQTAAVNVFKATMGSVNNYISENSMAWVTHLGSMEMISYDRISTLETTGGSPDLGKMLYDTGSQGAGVEERIKANTSWLGDTQIAEIHGAMTDSPFKAVAASAGHKHMNSGAFRKSEITNNNWSPSEMGAQEPLHDYTMDVDTRTVADGGDGENAIATTSEMWKLYGSKATKGICGWGVPVFALHGDTHYPCERYFYDPQGTDFYEIEILELTSGATSSRLHHDLHDSIVAGYTNRSDEVLYVDSRVSRDPNTSSHPFGTHLIVNMKGGGDITVDYINAHDGESPGSIARQTTIRRGRVSVAPDKRRYGDI